MALKEKGRDVTPEERTSAERDAELAVEYAMRVPKGMSEFQEFESELEDDQKPFARLLWQMVCPHVKDSILTMRNGKKTYKCERCGKIINRKKHDEWRSYCPDGFDMFEWDELYSNDKEMWPLIFDEVQAAMLEDTMTQEGGNEPDNDEVS